MIIWNGAGDWNNPYNHTQHAVPTPMTTMPAWYDFAHIVSRTATLLGNKKDAQKYASIAQDIKDRFNKSIFTPIPVFTAIAPIAQTGQVLPLAVDMVPDHKEKLTYQRLIDAIHLHGDHIGTGFVSTDFLLQALAPEENRPLPTASSTSRIIPVGVR